MHYLEIQEIGRCHFGDCYRPWSTKSAARFIPHDGVQWYRELQQGDSINESHGKNVENGLLGPYICLFRMFTVVESYANDISIIRHRCQELCTVKNQLRSL